MAVLFADLSHHQTGVDLAAYQRAGHDRVCIKATGGAVDGTLRYVDPAFADRWRTAGDLGLHRIAYHYARNNNPGADELAWCLDRVNAAGGLRTGDVLCYDQEDTLPGGPGLARQRTREFVGAAVQAGTGTGWIYSGKWYLDPAGLRAADLPAGWQRLWISDYTPGQADTQIEVPAGWSRAQFVARQFTDQAAVPGVSGGCDYSRVLIEWINTGDDSMSAAEVATLAAKIDDVKTAVNDARDLLYEIRRGKIPDGRGGWVVDAGHAEMADTTANARLTDLRALVAKIGVQVGALSDAEAKLLAATDAATVKILAAVQAVIVDPQVPNSDPDAFVAALADTLARGKKPA
jgi:GH25 family lysozyme M1 (1,4-beta-N-acetylmuramidase)